MNVMERTLRERIDPALTASALSALGSRALDRDCRARSVTILTGGCWNRVIAARFEGGVPDLVFKISAHGDAPDIEREFSVLRFFAEKTAMPVPRPYLLDASCAIVPGTLLVMERLPGDTLHALWGTLTERQRSTVATEIADHIVALHGAKTTGFGGVELDESQRESRWIDFWLPRFRRVLEEARRERNLTAAFLDRVERVSACFEALLDIGPGSTLTHYDIWSGNVIVEDMAGRARVSGFIDVPGYWADYAREISFMEMFGLGGAELHGRYREAHEIDPGFRLRTSIYNLKMHMKHVSMYPSEPYYRSGAEACLRAIEHALRASHP
jgi:protein-ribulosamine 3-kinase